MHEQLEWLEDDLKGRSASTPIVLFAHIPLWTIYPDWGWGTDDSEQALSYVKRFGSVTVLNGHIHQIMQKVEGKVSFHTAMSTAFPQPAPGTAPSAGPMKVPADQLQRVLGHHRCELPGQRTEPCGRRFTAWGIQPIGAKQWTQRGSRRRGRWVDRTHQI